MRRLLTALTAALLVAGLFPLTAIGGVPTPDDKPASTSEDTSVAIVLTATEDSGPDVTAFSPSDPDHGSLAETGLIQCDGQVPNACSQEFTYTPDDDYNGSDSFTYTATSDGSPSPSATVSITVDAVNDVPSFTVGADVIVAEDSGSYGDSSFITAGSAGPADESQSLTYTVAANNTALFGSQPAISPSGGLSFTPAADAHGSTSVSVTADDGGLNGTSGSQAFTITISSVNDVPTFTVGADVTVAEDSGSYGDSAFITDGSVGPADESAQSLTYTVAADDTALFGSQPAISPSGGLSFTPAADAHGSTSVSVTADDGGLNGTSGSQAFTISVSSVNDAPSFTKGPNVMAANAGDVTRSGWATSITDGGGESDALAFALTPADPTLFTSGPAIDASTGDLTFTPSGTAGSTSVQVRVDDDGTPPASSPNQSFTIAILDGPAADPQAISVAEDSHDNPITLTGTDPEDDPLTFVATQPAHGTLSGTAPDLTYTPAPNFFGSDSFTYTATDGTDTSPAAAVAITVTSGNDDPVLAKNDAVAVKATVTTVLNPMANDSGGAGETLAGVTITAVTQPAKGSATITNGGTRVTYDPTSCATGGDVFTYTISDGGSTSTRSVAVTINRPGQGGNSTSPLTDTPETRFVTNSTMGTTIPLRVTWCGVTTASTSVRSHRVQQSTNSGSTYPTTLLSATTAKSSTRNVSKDQDYRWRIRTVDSAGRTGSYRSSLVSIVRRYQESSSRITYSTGWGSSSTGSPSGGSQRFAKSAGRTAQITVTDVRAFAIVGPKSSTRGTFKVFVDNVLVATVSEKASSTVYRRVLYTRTLASGTHTIKLESSSSARIDLDAILTLAAQ